MVARATQGFSLVSFGAQMFFLFGATSQSTPSEPLRLADYYLLCSTGRQFVVDLTV